MSTARLKLCTKAWRVKQAVSDGDLPPTSNTDLARYVVTFADGTAVQAAGDAMCDTQPSRGQGELQASPEVKLRPNRRF